MQSDSANIAEQFAAFREQLTALTEQQKVLCALLGQLLNRQAESRNGAEPMPHSHAVPGLDVVAECGKDILGVLQEARQPLTILEILDELVRRQRSWRENTVRHALTTLLEEGAVADRQDVRPHSYGVPVRV